jgi:phosphoribosyl 1,2-cyclic phosphodiesterase
MQIHVLASGSTGNATFIQLGNANILIDAGISTRRIKNSLSAVGMAIEDLDGVLITHEHRDHVAGLTTLTKKYRLPVYTRPDTWQAMHCKKDLPAECCCEMSSSLDIKEVKIESFDISHDAADPVGYNLYYKDTKCSVATDLGFVTNTVKNALKGADAMVFESNHDVDMLKTGSYPWYLKKRIMSNKGHLSNVDAGWTLAKLDRKSHTDVFLAHLSQENNRPEIAKSTVEDILQGQGCILGQELSITTTYPDRIASLVI